MLLLFANICDKQSFDICFYIESGHVGMYVRENVVCANKLFPHLDMYLDVIQAFI